MSHWVVNEVSVDINKHVAFFDEERQIFPVLWTTFLSCPMSLEKPGRVLSMAADDAKSPCCHSAALDKYECGKSPHDAKYYFPGLFSLKLISLHLMIYFSNITSASWNWLLFFIIQIQYLIPS